MILVIQITSSEALKVKEKHSNSEIKYHTLLNLLKYLSLKHIFIITKLQLV